MLKDRLGDRLETWALRLFPFLFWGKLPPTALTVTGTTICLGAAVAFARGAFGWGGFLLLLGGFFDLVDGIVARRLGLTTRLGAFLDSTLDRLVDMAVLVGLMVHYAAAGDPSSVLLAGIALITSVMTSYARARAESLGPAVQVGVLERGERTLLVALGGLTGWMVIMLWVLAVGGLITVAQRFERACRELARRDAAEANGSAGEQV